MTPPVVPTRGVPVARVVSYTKKYINGQRLIGAECHQLYFNGLSKDFYTYHLTKGEKKKYWKKVSDMLDSSRDYPLQGFKSFKEAKKARIPLYPHNFNYVQTRSIFDPCIDIVVGVKVN